MRVALLPLLLAFVVACGGGFDGSGGKVDVRFCGNGTLDPGEDCDDGGTEVEVCAYNEAGCTICDATCRLVPGATSFCGDGRRDDVHEGCDDGNTVTEGCRYGETCNICDDECEHRVVARYCGDAIVDEADGEACDDGEANSDTLPDACRTNCRRAHCGDGVLDADEGCEPGLHPACRADCTEVRCGDGVVDPGEECDPASGADDDCRADCVLPSCGDGIASAGEACDDGEFLPVDLAGNGEAACAIDAAGQVRCFGGSDAFRNVPPALALGARSLSAGEGWACAISAAGELVCWGEEPVGMDEAVLVPPAGSSFEQVAAGDAHACALDALGEVVCWGRLGDKVFPPYGQGWLEVVAGRGFSCARHADGRTRCWGAPTFGVEAAERAPGLLGLAAAGNRVCGANRDGSWLCWGDARGGGLDLPFEPILRPVLGTAHGCALDVQREVICWGDGAGALRHPPGPFTRLMGLGEGLCGLRDDGLLCWGEETPPLALNADGVPGACRSDCTAPRCGDGVVDPGEACDDGNQSDDGNGCGVSCERVAVCGDGIVQAAFEECDDGNAFDEACDYGTSCQVCGASCTLVAGAERVCGDSRLEPEEGCDDGTLGIRFRTISMGGNHACGVLEDGRARCFGNPTLDNPPAGPFAAVEAGESFACGLLDDGAIACWGSLQAPEVDPERRFASIDAGPAAACALDESGSFLCWGNIAEPPGGEGWLDVSVGRASACAIDRDGAILCWGEPTGTPPDGTFTRVSVGTAHHCATDREDRLHCWGSAVEPNLPPLRVIDFASGLGQTCLIDRGGMLRCVGTFARNATPGLFRSLSLEDRFACAIGEDGLTTCWGADDIVKPPRNEQRDGSCRPDCTFPVCGDMIRDAWEQCDAGPGGDDNCEYMRNCQVCSDVCTFIPGYRPYCGDGIVDPAFEGCDDGAATAIQVGRGEDFTCIRHTSTNVRCWGRDDEGQSTPPPGAFTDLAVGARHACALDRTGRAKCWGASDRGQLDAPQVELIRLAAGGDFTCGQRRDGGLACWGDVPFAPPQQSTIYRELGAGDRHLCGIRSTHQIDCWGDDSFGQATPPAGVFENLVVGTRHACAFSQGVATCWGDDASGQASPPPGAQLHAQIGSSAGGTTTCARNFQNQPVCWGTAPADAGAFPDGQLYTLALARWGHGFACGTTTAVARELICWGSPGLPEAELPAFNSATAPDACRSDCRPARCGDGVVDTGEACDDGNTEGADGCSASCAVE